MLVDLLRPLQIALSIYFSADKELAGYVESMNEITSAEATDFEINFDDFDDIDDANNDNNYDTIASIYNHKYEKNNVDGNDYNEGDDHDNDIEVTHDNGNDDNCE